MKEAGMIIPRSPGFKNRTGFCPNPTPAGVPVAITSPALRVVPAERVLIRVGMENIRSSVVASWRFSPLTKVCTRSFLGRYSAGTAMGPCIPINIGVRESRTSYAHHWTKRVCGFSDVELLMVSLSFACGNIYMIISPMA